MTVTSPCVPGVGSAPAPSRDPKRENREHFNRLRDSVRQAQAQALAGGPPEAVAKHKGRGKLLARERIDSLIDSGTAFFEIGQIAGHGLHEAALPSAGLVTGVGVVHGSICAIYANDATVKGGAFYPITLKKHLRMQDIARRFELPSVYLVDSGGVHLPMQEDIFPGENHLGKLLKNIAEMSAAGLPQIAAVLGACTAGGVYIPTMCDEVVIVEGSGQIFLGGPQFVKAATGVDIEAEELGGARLHTELSGFADHLAHSEAEAIEIVRSVVARGEARGVKAPSAAPREPAFSDTTLPEHIPASAKTPMVARDIIARLMDGSELTEYKRHHGTSIVCGTGFIEGYRVGVIANDGILFSSEALKAANFIELCVQRSIPLLFLHNINGFMVGMRSEEEGLAKHGAKLIKAVACARVPKISVVVGGSYGAGNFAMCGRSMGPDLMAMWPNGKTSVVGAEQAAAAMAAMKVAAARKRGEELTDEQIEAISAPIRQSYEEQGSPLYAGARLWADAVIEPEDTRRWLGLALSMVPQNKQATPFGVFRM